MKKPRPRGPYAADIIREKQNSRLGWTSALAEWIDNSVGNGATSVHVEVSKNEAKVRDNGNGCTDEMFAALISLGWHQEDDSFENRVSRYGVGAKDAMLWFGGPTVVVSSRGDLHQFTEVDWESFTEEFEYDEPICGPLARQKASDYGLGDSGVVVHATSHRRRISDTTFEQIHASLSRLFWAAVETGVTINVTYTPNLKRPRKDRAGGPLLGKPMPNTVREHSIDKECTLNDGRVIRLVGGVLEPGVKWSSPGFEYIYGHRVVIEAGGTGAGAFQFERLYVRVFLLGDKEAWNVTTNKTGLHDADEATLSQAVYDACEPLLKVASSEAFAKSMDDELFKELSESLDEAARKKAKRGPRQNNSGTKKPSGNGSQHENAENTGEDDGNCRRRRKSNRARKEFSIFRAEFDADTEHLYGIASVKDRIVRLNESHPAVAAAISNRDKVALLFMAWSLWADAWTYKDETGQIKTRHEDDFVEKMSAMLKINCWDCELTPA